MIERKARVTLENLAKQFKSVAVVGPRQSGKTTLVKLCFPNLPYVNLENPDIRKYAIDDPRGFLTQYYDGAIFDEVQRVPELFSYLQEIIDNSDKTGKFILTGSNNFLLQQNISQSLAGRIAYLFLLPFTYDEIKHSFSSDSILLNGMYPPVYNQPVNYELWYQNYIRTYIERDVRQIKNITDLYLFEKFLRLCAGRVGQLLNLSNLSIETGVDSKTISSWIGVLESSFIVYRLQPHYVNFNKRLVKMPKLYFYDTGIVCSLLGIKEPNQLLLNPMRGNIFENFILSELVKSRFNSARSMNLYFWRDNTGNEIDIIFEKNQELIPIEIKSGKTVTEDYFKGIKFWQKIGGNQKAYVVYDGDIMQTRSNNIQVIPWKNLYQIDDLK
jgi:predicted AAA+ superfamily ATPase